jgi:hypothetical protein
MDLSAAALAARLPFAFPVLARPSGTHGGDGLIEESNRPLAEIAEPLGFSAPSAMARWFRGRFGCSVSQWRNGTRPRALTTVGSRVVAGKTRSTSKMKRPLVSARRSNRLGR